MHCFFFLISYLCKLCSYCYHLCYSEDHFLGVSVSLLPQNISTTLLPSSPLLNVNCNLHEVHVGSSSVTKEVQSSPRKTVFTFFQLITHLELEWLSVVQQTSRTLWQESCEFLESSINIYNIAKNHSLILI